jgi:hypothetical protein
MDPRQPRQQEPSSNMSEEQRLLKMYGRLPSKSDLLNRKLKDRKFFDSGDYALSKAGKAPTQNVGQKHPEPEDIPHRTSPPNTPGGQNIASPPRRPSTMGNYFTASMDQSVGP